jgi:hypothetical protein
LGCSCAASRASHQTAEEFATDEGTEACFQTRTEVSLLDGCAHTLPDCTGEKRTCERGDAGSSRDGGGEGGPKEAQDHRKHGSPSIEFRIT